MTKEIPDLSITIKSRFPGLLQIAATFELEDRTDNGGGYTKKFHSLERWTEVELLQEALMQTIELADKMMDIINDRNAALIPIEAPLTLAADPNFV